MKSELSQAKKAIQVFYETRIDYDNDFTRSRALRLVELAPLKAGDWVLDNATGTGIVAIAASHLVGQGKVIGVDFTSGMLAQARQKIAQDGISNIDLIEADVEEINFEPETFDVIFCSWAIVLLKDIPQALKKWYSWLKPKGCLVFSCHAEDAFFTPLITRACAKEGITLPNLHQPLGTPKKCYDLLQKIGYQNVNIITEQFGYYLTTQEAKQWWQGLWLHPQGHPLLNLNEKQLQKIIHHYQTEIEQLDNSKGILLDMTTFLITAYKGIL